MLYTSDEREPYFSDESQLLLATSDRRRRERSTNFAGVALVVILGLGLFAASRGARRCI